MKINWDEIKIFIKPGATDMRKQINGLAILIQEEMSGNPLDGNLYLFCSKNKSRLKILYWDRNGFCLWLKRLEQDKFPWPNNSEECRELSGEEFKMLLDGINFFNAHKELIFSAVI
jgi:transposase